MLAQTSVPSRPHTADVPMATGPMTGTMVDPSFSDILVTITRGREKLATETASKTKTRDDSGYITLTGTVTPATTPTPTPGPTVDDDETSTSIAAAARITGAAQWVAGGVAAAALAYN